MNMRETEWKGRRIVLVVDEVEDRIEEAVYYYDYRHTQRERLKNFFFSDTCGLFL